jgi:hypothetical protein
MLFSDAMSGSAWIRAGSCWEPLQPLPRYTPKLVHMWGCSFRTPHSAFPTFGKWGNVGGRATTPVPLPVIHNSFYGPEVKKQHDVIKCNHFPAQPPTFTLNTARLTPPHPALPRTHVIKKGSKTHHLPAKLLHQSTRVIILHAPLPSTVYRPPSTVPPNFMEFDTLDSIIPSTPASATHAAGLLLALPPRGTRKP